MKRSESQQDVNCSDCHSADDNDVCSESIAFIGSSHDTWLFSSSTWYCSTRRNHSTVLFFSAVININKEYQYLTDLISRLKTKVKNLIHINVNLQNKICFRNFSICWVVGWIKNSKCKCQIHTKYYVQILAGYIYFLFQIPVWCSWSSW